MQKIFEDIISSLENEKKFWEDEHFDKNIAKAKAVSYAHAIEIVKKGLEKLNDDWVPISSGKLPAVPEGNDYVDVLITKQYTSSAEVVPTEYYEEDGFNDCEKSLITAWKYDNFPEPYQIKGESK